MLKIVKTQVKTQFWTYSCVCISRMKKKKNMKKSKQKRSAIEAIGERIKVRLDEKTILFLRSKQALKMWLSKYPGAKVVA